MDAQKPTTQQAKDCTCDAGVRRYRAGIVQLVKLTCVGLGAAVLASQKAHAGFGRCSQCNCPQFAGNADLCANCGHQFSSHWNN